MSERKGAHRASSGGDTAFRKTWDREEYAAKAAQRDQKIKDEGKARHEAALAGKKYIRRASTPDDARDTEARQARFNYADQIGTTTLVPAGAGQGKRGKGAGLYCDACDLTFKDNLQWMNHVNSKQHQANTGQTGLVKRATLSEVKERLEYLKRKRDDEKANEVVDLPARIEIAKEQDEKLREEKRRKRNEKRRKTKDGMGVPEVTMENDGVIC